MNPRWLNLNRDGGILCKNLCCTCTVKLIPAHGACVFSSNEKISIQQAKRQQTHTHTHKTSRKKEIKKMKIRSLIVVIFFRVTKYCVI